MATREKRFEQVLKTEKLPEKDFRISVSGADGVPISDINDSWKGPCKDYNKRALNKTDNVSVLMNRLEQYKNPDEVIKLEQRGENDTWKEVHGRKLMKNLRPKSEN
jgi:hypothetical protein